MRWFVRALPLLALVLAACASQPQSPQVPAASAPSSTGTILVYAPPT